MANKAISELPQAQNVNNQDLFVLEQSGIAKKLTAETFITEQGIINALAEALDGHGGIQSVTLSSVSGRIRTYRITFTDQSATTFQVYDGTSIDRISRTSSSGLDDVYTIFLSDGTTTFFTVHNGADGNVSEAMLNDALKDKAPVITETTESSAIANFTDGADNMVMHNVVAEINPVQDLHGLNYPYPAGSQTTNLFKATAYRGEYNAAVGTDLKITTDAMAYSLSSEGVTVHVTTAWRYRLFATDSLPAGTYSVRTQQISSAARSTVYVTDSDLEVVSVVYNQSYAGFSSAYTVTIEEGQRIAYAVGSYAVADELVNFAVVEGSTINNLPLFENICPITGHTEVNVTRAGKNLFDQSTVLSSLGFELQSDGSWLYTRDSYWPVYQQKVWENATGYTGQIAVSLDVKYGTSGKIGLYFKFVYTDGTTESIVGSATGDFVSTSAVSNASKTVDYIMTYFSYNANQSSTAFKNVQIELGSTATTYEAYQGATATISWQTEAGTVYGGTIDVATGLLTVDRAIVDLGSLTWNYIASSGHERFVSQSPLSGAKTAGGSIIPNALSSQFKVTSSNGVYAHTKDNTFSVTGEGRAEIYASAYTDATAFKTAMNGVQLVYELATPQTYLLSPQQLMTLLGTNNVWSDVGNVSVTYPADTKMFIEKLTMPTEDDLVANQAITSGKYFMIGNSLYLALANIASGAQITIGTNAQRVSLADALNTINS